jgi:DNA-binding XRE family transcriptional regulator
MIKNEKQYKITSKLLADWEANLSLLVSSKMSKTPDWIYKAQVETAKHEIKQLKSQLKEYEDLKSGKQKLPDLGLVNDLPLLLIKWRIYRKLTQKELAELLGLYEQQIQKYEETNYSGASLATISKVAETLSSYKCKPKRHSA